jgi:hypothetical protein
MDQPSNWDQGITFCWNILDGFGNLPANVMGSFKNPFRNKTKHGISCDQVDIYGTPITLIFTSFDS